MRALSLQGFMHPLERACALTSAVSTLTVLLGALPLNAQTIEQLHAFESTPFRFHASLIQATDGAFYGTSSQGGTNNLGTVFKISPAGVLTTLVSFNGINGASPSARLVQANDGNFYGTTYYGGPDWSPSPNSTNGFGTVFRMTSAGVLTTLFDFPGGAYGANPWGGLVQASDGNFYGTTTGGGSGYGIVYRITPAGALTIVARFTLDNGATPYGDLVQGKDGWLYGTTYGLYGTFAYRGTVFKVSLSGTFTNLFSFSNGSTISVMAGLVQGSDGMFYGTAIGGQPAFAGLVFKMTPEGKLTSLVTFLGSNGNTPLASLVQGTDGNFYGTTQRGGAYDLGTVFKVTPTGTLSTLVSFDGANGSLPQAGLVLGTDGNFYGATDAGNSGKGTVFKMTPAGALTTLFPSTNSEGFFPCGKLVEGTDGNLYGTTFQGGAGSAGTVFKISRAGALTTLASFHGKNGGFPVAGVVQGSDGNFYGTTSSGSNNGFGTVFKITPAGDLDTLVFFNGTNGWSPSGVVEGADGSYYGTTFYGGPDYQGDPTTGNGTVFKISTSGVLATLWSRAGHPCSGLLRSTDGNFYGTTLDVWPTGGTIFRMAPGGAVTTVALLNATNNGDGPYGDLVQRSNGDFYGTTLEGGPYHYRGTFFGFGTVFKVTPTGGVSTVFEFDGRHGANPRAGLVQASDDNFYGTTSQPIDVEGYGTVFWMAPSGALTTILSFDRSNGAAPCASLVQASDGNLYGTTSSGGPRGGGTVFRLNLVPRITALRTSAGSVILSWTTIPGRTYRVQASSDLSAAAWSDIPPDISATGTSLVLTNTGPSAARFFRVALLP